MGRSRVKFTQMVSFVVTPEDLARWTALAAERKMSRSNWFRAACHAFAGTEAPPPSQKVPSAPRKPYTKRDKSQVVATSLIELAAQAPDGPCENRLPKGAFCKRCGRIHQ